MTTQEDIYTDDLILYFVSHMDGFILGININDVVRIPRVQFISGIPHGPYSINFVFMGLVINYGGGGLQNGKSMGPKPFAPPSRR